MAGGRWVTVRWGDIAEEPTPYKHVAHSFTERISKKSTWPWPCKRCGLVLLKNKATEHCVRLGCYYADHPSMKGGHK